MYSLQSVPFLLSYKNTKLRLACKGCRHTTQQQQQYEKHDSTMLFLKPQSNLVSDGYCYLHNN